MAEIDEPPGHQPPPQYSGGGSDMSGTGLAKAVGGCCGTFCLLAFGFSFLLVGIAAWLYPPIGFTFTFFGLALCILGFFAARWEWGVIKSS